MRNSENRPYPTGSEELKRLLAEAKTEERCARALAVSLRLEALAEPYLQNRHERRRRCRTAVPRGGPLRA